MKNACYFTEKVYLTLELFKFLCFSAKLIFILSAIVEFIGGADWKQILSFMALS